MRGKGIGRVSERAREREKFPNKREREREREDCSLLIGDHGTKGDQRRDAAVVLEGCFSFEEIPGSRAQRHVPHFYFTKKKIFLSSPPRF